MSVFDIGEKLNREWLLANGWNWDSVDHKYVKNVYNLLIVSEGRSHLNSLSYAQCLHTPHVVNLTLIPRFGAPWESPRSIKYEGRLDYCYGGSPWNTSTDYREFDDISDLILWQETIKGNVLNSGVPERFIRL